jgi:hypothetical protein
MPEPPVRSGEPFSNQMFNNADSFAQAFDEAWQEHQRRQPNHDLDTTSKLALILKQLEDHPFRQNQPSRAAEVASFRVRLLGL